MKRPTGLGSVVMETQGGGIAKQRALKDEVPWALIGLRGCLALLVIFDHSMGQLDAKFDMVNIWGYDLAKRVFCHRAIILFFVLSAYQLTLKFLKECPAPDLTSWKSNESMIMWGKYAIRRFFRIYPAFIAIQAALVIWPALNAGYWDVPEMTWPLFWRHLALDDLGGIFWTIPSEMQYYVVIPIFVMVYKAAESADMIARARVAPAHSSFCGLVASVPFRCSFRILALLPGCLTAWKMRLTPNAPPGVTDLCALEPFFITFYLGSLCAVVTYNAQRAVDDHHPGFTIYSYLLSTAEHHPLLKLSIRMVVAALTWAFFVVSIDINSLVSTVNEEGHVHFFLERPGDNVYVVVCALLVFMGGTFSEHSPGE